MAESATFVELAPEHADDERLVSAATFAIVLTAMTFNMALCFVNTRTGGIGNSHVIASEVVIICVVFALAYRSMSHLGLFLLSVSVLYLSSLAIVRTLAYGGHVQVKPIRDLIIPIAFFLLGARVGSIRLADTLVRVAAGLVVFVGLIELSFPDQFTKVFDVAKFYVNRGAMVSDQAQMTSNLFISGMRPEELGGRNLLPFLGAHRVSSIFLEPITAGNFGVLVVMWALVRSSATRRPFWGMLIAGAVIIVLSDSRFGLVFCAIALAIALLPTSVSTPVAIVLPAFALTGILLAQDHFAMSHATGNGFVSRFILSADFLERLTIANVFGVQAPDFTAYDSGYAYLFCGIGIIGVLGFWAVLWSLQAEGRSFSVFRNQIAAYYAVLLCISNSAFTIKLASLLWFLAGTLYVARVDERIRGARPGPDGPADDSAGNLAQI